MSGESDPVPKGSQLRDEAANWFATMRGPEADCRRAEFDAWLARGALHRSAYNRIAETFSIGKALKQAPQQPVEPPSKAPRRRRKGPLLVLALTSAALAGTWMATWQLPRHSPEQLTAATSPTRPATTPLQLATRLGEIRTVRLSDGSAVTLDTDSLLIVTFGTRERSLRLERGRARFVVAHEDRAFIVRAGSGAVTARGTIFDVGIIEGDHVRVQLLRGAIDVSSPSPSESAHPGLLTTRLGVGEGLDIGSTPSPVRTAVPSDDLHWPEAVRDFDQIRLADLLREANRYRVSRIVLASPDIGDMRISGTFRLQDTQALPENLAEILGLTISRTEDTVILSRS